MATGAIHRCIEQQAAARPGAVALADARRTLSYRELNYRANACARHFMSHGFRRGTHAVVRMPRGADLAIVLLGVLKAGGSYTWIDSNQRVVELSAPQTDLGTPREGRCVDVSVLSSIATQPSPNLPVLTRGSDIACVLQRDGAAEVLVPHATLVALQRTAAIRAIEWTGDPGALDLWLGLMSGGTATLAGEQPSVAAA